MCTYFALFNIVLLLVLNSTDIFVNIPETQVGQSLSLECNITTVGYITGRVDIVWSKNNIELKRTEGVNVSYTNNSRALYVNIYNIFHVNTSDDGDVYQCQFIINQKPPLISVGATTLNVNGKYHLFMYLTLLCYTYIIM